MFRTIKTIYLRKAKAVFFFFLLIIEFVSFVSQLRILYEAIPMSYLIEEAGGLSSDGSKPILDIEPTELHERTPIFLGSENDVKELLKIIAKHKK